MLYLLLLTWHWESLHSAKCVDFSDREKMNHINPKDIFRYYRDGFSNKKIAKHLQIDIALVKILIADYRRNYKSFNFNSSRGLEGRDFIREQVRIRDNWTCQDCEKKWVKNERRFDVHHLHGLCGKKSKGYDKKKDISGLVTLCHKCHFNRPEHKINKKSYSESYM